MTMKTFDGETKAADRQKCEIWTRAMGYCRPVQNFNKGKKSEFKERKFFREAVAVDSMEGLDCGCGYKKVA